MAKLYFRYGTVGSAKTLNLLAVAHSYRQQSKRALLIKPELDTRFGKDLIKSRAGLETEADLLVSPTTKLDFEKFKNIHCVLVDECQFLSISLIEQLREIATDKNIPVICYGLRSDFRTNLFEGSQRLMEIADEIDEVKTTCFFCNRKAIFNLKLLNDIATTTGPAIDLGAEEKYLPTCAKCRTKKIEAGTRGEKI